MSTTKSEQPSERADEQETKWLDDVQQQLWRGFLGGTTVLLERLDRDLREKHNLSMPEYEILVRLSEAPERQMRMAMLADSVAQSRSRITHTIARLQNAGLVERNACLEDGRGVLAVLTAAGQATLDEAAHTHVRGVRAYLIDLIGPEDLATVGRSLGAVRAHLGGKPF